jgi:hypothetical protein
VECFGDFPPLFAYESGSEKLHYFEQFENFCTKFLG